MNSCMTIRPAGLPPIVMSKKTMGLFDAMAVVAVVVVILGCERCVDG